MFFRSRLDKLCRVNISKTRFQPLGLFAAAAAVLAWAALAVQLWLTVGIVVGQGRGVAMGLVVYFGFLQY